MIRVEADHPLVEQRPEFLLMQQQQTAATEKTFKPSGGVLGRGGAAKRARQARGQSFRREFLFVEENAVAAAGNKAVQRFVGCELHQSGQPGLAQIFAIESRDGAVSMIDPCDHFGGGIVIK